MKIKAGVVLMVMAGSFFLSSGPALATQWKYVGTTTLASGETRVDYIDVDSVIKDVSTGTMVYWVRSECKSETVAFRKMKRYMTKLDSLEDTKYLEWHVYLDDNEEIMRGMTPQQNWQDVEDTTLLSKAIEIAREYVKQ
jgi:hypothetical protein